MEATAKKRQRKKTVVPPKKLCSTARGQPGAVRSVLHQVGIQAKLYIGQINDRYEREADRVADQIMRPQEYGFQQKPNLPNSSDPVEELLPMKPLGDQVDRVVRRKSSAGGDADEEEGIVQTAARPNRFPAIDSHLESAIRAICSEGRLLDSREFYESRYGLDFSATRIHTDGRANDLAARIGARAFTFGHHILFGAGQYSPWTREGRRLIAHELTHVVQQNRPKPAHLPTGSTGAEDAVESENPEYYNRSSMKSDGGRTEAISGIPDPSGSESVRRDPLDETDDRELQVAEEHMPEDSGIPDEEITAQEIEWPRAQRLNLSWWERLDLVDVMPIRDYDPVHQPRAWANKIHTAQQILREAGITRIENRPLRMDGILGPRTMLALRRVALNESHPARTDLQTLGFNLEAITAATAAERTALAELRSPEILLEWDFNPLGERVIRYYDLNFDMVISDRQTLDRLLFGDDVPEGIRRGDRIELLRRFYGREENRLPGRIAFITVDRPFVHRLDAHRVRDRDRRAGQWSIFMRFWALNGETSGALMDRFEQRDALAEAIAAADEDTRAALNEAVPLMRPPAQGAAPHRELAGFIFITYLPPIAENERIAIVDQHLAERAERQRSEEAARAEHNLDAARERADALIQMMDDEDANAITRQLHIESFLRRQLPDRRHFALVIDDLTSRNPDQFTRLFDVLDNLDSPIGQGILVELCLTGRYADHPRVQALMTELNRERGERQDHRYIPGDDPHVMIRAGFGHRRLSIGQVAGDVSDLYYRDETRERLKPESEERLSAELERQARIYFRDLANGREEERSTDDIGMILLQRAWQEANMSEDSDIEEIEVRESYRLQGVREAPDRGDGIRRWEVQYQSVVRVIGDDSDTGWVDDPESLEWRSDSEFENAMWWLSFSQTADIIQTAAMVVAVGAVVVVAWEVGAIAALVQAGGGWIPVVASIAISEVIYMLTHERWTLRGLLVAGIEGYLGALGFRFFAPVGAAVAGRIGTSTFRQLVIRWLVRHGTTGALTGVVVGPAGVFAEDIIRIAQEGGGRFSGVERYLTSAAVGLLVGAVAEIGGSALLAPIFRTADVTALTSLDEVLEPVISRGIPSEQWIAHMTGALSGTRRWLRGVVDDAIADGMYAVIRQRISRAIVHYSTGFRIMILRQIVDMADQPLTRQGVEGLEALLRTTRGHMRDDALTALLNHVARDPARIPGWFHFLGGLDDDLIRSLATDGQLRQLADAPASLALAGRHSSAEVAGLLGQRFGNTVNDLEDFASRLSALDDDVADEVLQLLSTRGATVTPDTLLRMASLGLPLNGNEVTGLVRLMSTSADAAKMEQLLLSMPNNRLRDFVLTGHGANPADLAHLHSLAIDPQIGRRLLMFVDDTAEAIRLMGTVDAALVTELDNFLQAYGGWRRNAERGLMRLVLESPGSVDTVRLARMAMDQHDLPGIESWTVLAGRQARNPAQLRDLELSLRDAIPRRAADPATAIEVNYYAGARQTRAQMQALRAGGGFNPDLHVNMDVVTTTQIREFKRANAAITTSRQFSRRLGNGASDFTTLGRNRQALGGTHEHVLFIDFNTQLDSAFRTNTWLQARVLAYAARNADFRRTVDRLVIQLVDPAGMPQTFTINIPI